MHELSFTQNVIDFNPQQSNLSPSEFKNITGIEN